MEGNSLRAAQVVNFCLQMLSNSCSNGADDPVTCTQYVRELSEKDTKSYIKAVLFYKKLSHE